MILCDRTLEQMLNDKKLVVHPMEPKQVQPASIDLRIGNSFFIPVKSSEEVLDIRKNQEGTLVEKDEIVIPAHTFILATTIEYIKIPKYLTAWLEGRSSIGRKGLFVQNAGWIDPGFEGEITLELYNANDLPLKIYAGDRVCQLIISNLDQECKNAYNGKYQRQRNATQSRLYFEFVTCVECKKTFDLNLRKTFGTPEGVMTECPYCHEYTPT